MKTKYGLNTAISIVVANMIGTGIFTSLGFQVMDLHSGFALLILWLIGGFTALIGAMAYAELGARMTRSGGEYHFLSEIYHPALGFVSGWISFIVGFTAALAAASIALSAYFTAAIDAPASFLGIKLNSIVAILVILFLTLLHAKNKKAGAGFQNIMTGIKIIILLIFIIIGWKSLPQSETSFSLNRESLAEIVSAPFAIALFFVSFAYSGWNAAAYISGEIRNPERNIPGSLILGTFIVTLLYLGITWVFIKIIPIEMMYGKIEIGYLYGKQIFGERSASVVGLLFALLLFSNVSSLTIIGPRVTHVMGEDYPAIRWFARISSSDTPARAIYIQAVIAIIYIISATFEQMITFIGFTLNLMTMLTVLGLIILRRRSRNDPQPGYKIKPYPLLPMLFLFIGGWIMVYGFIYKPVESLAGVATAGIGFIIWLFLRKV